VNYKEEAIIRLKECIADCTSGEDDIYKSAFATAILALRKQIPTKVRTKKCEDCEKEDCGSCEDYYNRCPECNEGLDRDSGEIFKFCPECGQALDWEN
jgi:hypothetical protein